VSTNNFDVSNVEWNPPTIAGIAVYIWPYIIVGLWHFMTAAGIATSVKVFPISEFKFFQKDKSKLKRADKITIFQSVFVFKA
jgi:hypothetical protein